jgi:serine/threonine protein kinase
LNIYNATMPRHFVGDYVLLNTVGQGTYGKVKHAVHSVSGEEVAIKIVSKHHSSNSIGEDTDVFSEVEHLRRFDHPNIIKLIKAKHSARNIYMIMEYVNGGTLHDRVELHQRLSERETCKYTRQLLSAVHHMHAAGVVHRDIKLENIMLTEDDNVVMIDFGYSSTYTRDSLLYRCCGSPHFVAPEIVQNKPYNGCQVDIWSLGICIYAMHAGYFPFNASAMKDLQHQVVHQRIRYPLHFSRGLKRFLNGLLCKDPQQRKTLEKLLNDPWLFKFTSEPVPLIAPLEARSDTSASTAVIVSCPKNKKSNQLVAWFKKCLGRDRY